MKRKIERRAFHIELRVKQEADKPPMIAGHAALFNTLSEDLGGFRETIMPGAFAKTLQEADVRALLNHDPNMLLGRTKSGTLRLAEDEQGLAFEIDPPETGYANDLLTSMRRGDLDQMSFGFQVVKDRWIAGDEPVRELVEVRLFDVSPVTFPAYPQTDASVRTAEDVLASYEPPEPEQALHSLALRRKRLELAIRE